MKEKFMNEILLHFIIGFILGIGLGLAMVYE